MSTPERPRCRQCDHALKPVHAHDQVRTELVAVDGDNVSSHVADIRTTRLRGRIIGYGYAASGYFCTLTCGHAYAVGIIRDKEREGL